jgi:hypothetical protein
MNQSKDYDWIQRKGISMLEEQRHTKLMDEFSKSRRIELLEGRCRSLEARVAELETLVKAIDGGKVGPVTPNNLTNCI